MKERELVRSNEELDERVIGNPIHAYKTVKRFAIDLKKIENDLQEDDWKGMCICDEKYVFVFYIKFFKYSIRVDIILTVIISYIFDLQKRNSK